MKKVYISLGAILLCFLLFLYITGPVSLKSVEVDFTIDEGDTYSMLGDKLKDADLIKSKFMYKVYVKIFKPENLQVCTHTLNKNMNLNSIIDFLSISCTSNPDAITITFKEGINIKNMATLIANETNNKEEDVFNLLKSDNYIDSLITEYWFLASEIKNKEIYYPLEGYLYPNTYEFMNKDVSVSDIFKKMLDETDRRLTPYKEDFKNSEYTVHELLTLASIIELEAGNSDDRAGVASVFYNRLNDNWSLGSDVTTYYAVQKDFHVDDLYLSEINDYNAYNTRHPNMAGKLPVSPICNSSIESIEAVLNPSNTDYYYFVADKNGKTYFNRTSAQHLATVQKLKDEGLWYEYTN